MGQFISLIVIIAIFIIKALLKKAEAKKNARPIVSTAQHDEYTEENLTDNWEEWFNDKPEKSSSPQPFLNKELGDTKKSAYQSIVNREEIVVRNDHAKKKTNHKKTVKQPIISLKNTNDARRAIIYSEIIKRKY